MEFFGLHWDDGSQLREGGLKFHLFPIPAGSRFKSAAQPHFICSTTNKLFLQGNSEADQLKCSATGGECWRVCQFLARALKISITMLYLQSTQVCTAI